MTLQHLVFGSLYSDVGLPKGPCGSFVSTQLLKCLRLWAGARRGSPESPLFVMSKTLADGERCEAQMSGAATAEY